MCNILIGLIQLAAVDSVSRGAAYFACSYAADLAVLINGNLIVNLNIAAVQNDGGSAVGDFVAGYVDICQLAALVCIYAILGCDIAGGFDSTVGTADIYIFAGQVAKDDILVHVNLVELLAVNIGFFNVDVVAAYYLAVLACFGCYRMQLAAVYSIGGISSYCACCYTGNLAVCSNSYFAQFSAFGGDLAVVAACIAYEQLTVTQCGMTGEYTVLQYYVADFACSCDYFAVFIYGEVVICTIECAVAVYKERHDAVFICSAYGQVVFCVQSVGLDVVYTGDVALFVDGYFAQFSAFGSDLAVVAACIAYEQLAVTKCGMTGEYTVVQYYVADFACSCGYIAVFIYYEAAVCTIECAVAVYEERYSAVFICSTYGQVVFCVQHVGLNGVGLNGIYINIFVQLNLYIFAIIAYADVLVAAEVYSFTGCYFGCCIAVSRKVPALVCVICYFADFLQLLFGCSFTLAVSEAIISSSFIAKTAYGCSSAIHNNTACFYTACCYFAACPDSAFAAADAYKSVRIISFKINIVLQSNIIFLATVFIEAFGYSNIIITIGNSTVFECFCFYIFQLAIVYCIIFSSTCSYTMNLYASLFTLSQSNTIANNCQLCLTVGDICNAWCQSYTRSSVNYSTNIIELTLKLNFHIITIVANNNILLIRSILFTAEINGCTRCYFSCNFTFYMKGGPTFISIIRCRITSHCRSHACTGHNTCCNQHCQQLFGRAAFTAMIFSDFGDNNICVARLTPNYFEYFVHQ